MGWDSHTHPLVSILLSSLDIQCVGYRGDLMLPSRMALISAQRLCLHFHCPFWFPRKGLAHMLHSLVRVRHQLRIQSAVPSSIFPTQNTELHLSRRSASMYWIEKGALINKSIQLIHLWVPRHMPSNSQSTPRTGCNGKPSPPVRSWSWSSEHQGSIDGLYRWPSAQAASMSTSWRAHTIPPSSQQWEAYIRCSCR